MFFKKRKSKIVDTTSEGANDTCCPNTKRQKVFCIGRNKTGTTSLEQVFRFLGYSVGDQRSAELLAVQWEYRNWSPIVEYCNSADFFQDVPFSMDGTYAVLDDAYPDAKFILTIRDDSKSWYDSFIRFQTKILDLGRLPTANDLKSFDIVHRGWILEQQKRLFKIEDKELYNEELYRAHYENYNERVINHFNGRESKLLVLNLKSEGGLQKLRDFLGVEIALDEFPHLNTTN
jgi:hypothetical protein